MKRLVLLLSLALLLLLAACGGQPDSQELLPTGAAETPPADPATVPDDGAPDEGAPLGDQIVPVLPGTRWEWVEIVTPVETITAVDPARYVIEFNDDGTAFITADCNSVRATYEAGADGMITIVPGPSTLMACPEDTQDQVFLGALAAASNFFSLAGSSDLYIDQMADAGTLRLRLATGAPGAEAESEPATGLTGTTWEWVSLIDTTGQTAAADPTRYTVTFNEDGSATVVADCNNVIAQYITDGVNLEIAPGAGTLVACAEDSQDQLFLNSLLGAATYQVQDGELFIALEGGSDTLIFRPAAMATGETDVPGSAGTPVLTGITWEWTEMTAAATTTAIADPMRYAVTFNDDGSVNIAADCNIVLGTYTADADGGLIITLGPSTLAACPEDSQADAFVAGLAAANRLEFDGSDLLLHQAGDAGSFRFRPAAVVGDDGPGEAAPGDSGMSLTGGEWQWIETVTPVETITAADPTRYTVTFNEDGTAAIKADCNQVTATYTVADSALTITPGASTLAMCPADSQATPFLAGLSSAAIYFFQDGFLYIDQFASAGTMKFAAAGAASGAPPKGETVAPAGGLVGPLWQLNLITKTDGNITINDPSRYTIRFNDDGTANLQTDCNVGGATFTTGEGNALTITPGVSSMAFCGPGSLDQIMLGGLTNAMSYRMEDGNLLIDMLYESGTLVFMPAP